MEHDNRAALNEHLDEKYDKPGQLRKQPLGGDDELEPGSQTEKRMRPSEFAEYDELLDELAYRLKIARHPDSLVLLRAARSVIETIDGDLLSSSPKSASLAAPSQAPRQADDEQRQQQQHRAHATSRQKESQATSPSTAEIGRQRDETEIRIQQSKFILDDVRLPKSLVESVANNLAKQVPSDHDGGSARDGGDVGGNGRGSNKGDRGGVSAYATSDDGVGGSASCGPSPRAPPFGGVAAKKATTKDELVGTFERAAKALKLLYMDDQRQLQNQVNELISSIQSITANPKTDPRLLATGR